MMLFPRLGRYLNRTRPNYSILDISKNTQSIKEFRCSNYSYSSPQDKKYILQSKHEDCFIHGLSIPQRFFEQSTLWPNKIAVECGITGRRYTYGEMTILIRKFGSSLLKMGFRKGQVLGLVLPNIPEYPIIVLAAAGIGMIVTTVNPIYTAEEIARQMQDSDASAIVTFPAMGNTIRQVASECPNIRQLIVVGEPIDGFVTMKDMVTNAEDLYPDNLDVNIKEDVVLLPYSSGTTGLPKGVMLTHANLGINIQQYLHPGTNYIKTTTETCQETYICVLPFFHAYGLIVLMLAGLEHGAKLVTLPRFDADTYLKALDNHKPTILHLVPPLVTFLANVPGLKTSSLDQVHSLMCGAAPLGETAATKLTERVGRDNLYFLEGFGMTELSPVCLVTSLKNPKIGSCGVLVSRTRAKIIDLSTNEALGPGQTGELCVQGPQIMKGYHKNEKATRETIDEDGWLHTGDIAYYDEKERFYVVDRLKELIKVKSMQVAPSELEDILRKIPGIADVAVIGVPDEVAGELPRAYVVKATGEVGAKLTENDVYKFVESKVAPYKKLKGGVRFVSSIPKTNTGKILRRELRAAAISEKR